MLEDLGARGCRFADVRGAPSPAEAEALVRARATLHGTYAGPTESGALSWVVTNAADPAAPLTAWLLRLVVGRLRRTRPDLLPPDSALLIERQRQFEARLPRDGFTLLHGDPHFGNVYFDGEVPGFVDWQVLRRGLGLRDLAYFLTLSLPTERRRAEERHLLDLYRNELPRHGGPLLDRGELAALPPAGGLPLRGGSLHQGRRGSAGGGDCRLGATARRRRHGRPGHHGRGSAASLLKQVGGGQRISAVDSTSPSPVCGGISHLTSGPDSDTRSPQ